MYEPTPIDGLLCRLLNRNPWSGAPGSSPTCIYFIRRAIDDRIKIGYTSVSAESRLAALEVGGGPMKILAIAEVAYTEAVGIERLIHRHFDDSRFYGEWFDPTDDLMAFIKFVRIGDGEDQTLSTIKASTADNRLENDIQGSVT